MKKKMIALLAGALLSCGLAGNALAAFESLELTRVVYNSSTEVGTDLGNVGSFLGTGYTGTVSAGGSNYVSMLGSAANSSTWATYYAVDAGSNILYFSAQKGLGSIAVNRDNAANANQNLDWGVNSFYSNLAQTAGTDGTKSVSTSRSNIAGFFTTFEQGTPGAGGFMGSLDTNTIKSEASLASAAVQGLYFWDGVSASAAEVATITTNLDGTTSITSNSQPTETTPIPPAFLLMGSGLLGMVGMRRKKN